MASLSPSSINERRGCRLVPIQTNFSRPTTPLPDDTTSSSIDTGNATTTLRPRHPCPPAHPTTASTTQIDQNIHPQTQTQEVKRQQSKSGLRSLFGLGRSFRSRTKNDGRPVRLQVDEVPIRSHRPTTTTTTTPNSSSSSSGGSQGIDVHAPLPSPSACTTPNTTASGSTLISPSGVDPCTATTSANRPALSMTRFPSRPHGTSYSIKSAMDGNGHRAAWKPPPLFRAYSQAIKHGCLSLPVPASWAESLLRRRAARDVQNNTTTARRRDVQGNHVCSPSGDNTAATGTASAMNKMEWTQKIYFLTTSGYLLQYSNKGKFDRLPEKMIKLGPHSVAFASDAIPGKPWVLQVFQHHDEENSCATSGDRTTATAAADGNSYTAMAKDGGGVRPRLSRFPFCHSKWARTLLLVFDSPEDMCSWLVAVRTEIGLCRGMKYETDSILAPKEDYNVTIHRRFPNSDHPPSPRRRPTPTRTTIQRDLDQMSNTTHRPSQRWENDSATAADYQSRRTSYTTTTTDSANRRSAMSDTDESRLSSTSQSKGNGSDGSSVVNTTTTSSNRRHKQDAVYLRSQALPSGYAGGKEPAMTSSVPAASVSPSLSPSSSPSAVQEMVTTGRYTSLPTPNFSVPLFSKKSLVASSGNRTPAPSLQQQQQQPLRSATPSAAGSTMGIISHLRPPVPPKQEQYRKCYVFYRNELDSSSMDYSNAMAAFPSPPQSPTSTQGLSSPVQKGSNDKLSTGSCDSSVKVKQSAIPTSQNSLAEVVQRNRNATPNETKTTAPSQQQPILATLPKAVNAPSSLSSSSTPTPTPGVGRGGKAPYRRNLNRPCLSFGPPTTPPPTCPLPKIPSSFTSPVNP